VTSAVFLAIIIVLVAVLSLRSNGPRDATRTAGEGEPVQ
jgi:hypothetical protein